jgi:glyoxylase-like metal-dependent hydrolase (beta-lactamase superfamily II)
MPKESIETRRTRIGPFERIMFIAPDPIRPASQSVYRFGHTLIDSAGARVADALVDALRNDPPRRVLLTHQHEDHAGGVGALRRAFGHLPVHAARSYLPLLATVDRVPEYRARYWGNPEPIEDAIGFEPGQVFELDGLTLQTLETPGHTPFHITFVATIDDATYALTGDLFTTPSPLVAWFESAAEDTARSCRAVARAGPNLRVLPTHGRVRADGSATLLALAALMEEKCSEVIAMADRLGTRDYHRIALALFGDADAPMSQLSENEFAFVNFVRSVLDPVRELPATRVDYEHALASSL